MPPTSRPHRSEFTSHTPGLGMDDEDDCVWMYIATSRQTRTVLDKVSAKINLFDHMSPYERRYVRITVRQGAAQLSTFESDEPDEVAIATLDLNHIYNVRRIVVQENERLQFISFDDNEDAYAETVYGQIGIRLELLEPQGEYVDWVAVDKAMSTQADQLEREGKLLVLHLAFGNNEEREAWVSWFSELVVLRELREIEHGIHEVSSGAPETTTGPITPNVVLENPEGRRAVKNFVKMFLAGAPSDRVDTVPNKGKIDVRSPGMNKFSSQTVTCRFSTGELFFAPRQQKASFFRQELRVPQRLRLTEETRITVALPWSNEFQVYCEDSVIWSFQCRHVEERNAFVRCFRCVKGHGTLAQTEQETFPYLPATAAAEDEGEALAPEWHVGFGLRKSGGAHSDDHDMEFEVSSDEAARSVSPTRAFSPTRSNREVKVLPPPGTPQQPPPDDPWAELAKYESSVHSGESTGARSVRRFTCFPNHVQNFVQPWVNEGCRAHLLGRVMKGPELRSNHRNTNVASWIKSLSPIRTTSTSTRTGRPHSPMRDATRTTTPKSTVRRVSPSAKAARPATPTRTTSNIMPKSPRTPAAAAVVKPAASPFPFSRLQHVPRGAFSSHEVLVKASKVARSSGW